MKKTLLFMAAAGMLTAAHAEWKMSDMDHTAVGEAGVYGQSGVKTVKTPDGSIAVTWLQTPSDLGYADPDFGYYLHMQIYDAEGNAIFPQEGKLVVAKHTDSWYSDYALTCMDNGDILIGYNDLRTGKSRVYAYRYTQQGTPVWDAEGVLLSSLTVHEGEESDMSTQIVASGENIYVAFAHSEYWMEKATEDNWSPSPWFPDEEMPDSVSVSSSNYQLSLLNAADGSAVWDEPKQLEISSLFMYPAPEGCLYAVYANEDTALYADKYNAEGKNAWEESVPLWEQPLSSYGFVTKLPVATDDKGGLAIAMNIPNGWVHYNGITYLEPDGGTFFEPISGNEDPNTGDSEMAELAVKGDKIFAAWPYAYSSSQNYMWCNEFDKSGLGEYSWEGDRKYGLSLDMNDMWGMKAVKVVPQADGWVVIYGNCTSWSGADFMVVKVSDAGEEMWRKQICESNFKCSGLSVQADEQKAVIFYTCEQEYDDNWELIPGEGGMFVMCVALTDGDTPTAIRSLRSSDDQLYFDLQGRRYNEPQRDMLMIKK